MNARTLEDRNPVRLHIYLVGVLLLSLVPCAVAHAQFTTTVHDGQITIVKYTGTGGIVEIPSTINGLPVTGIGGRLVPNNAFSDCDNVTGITIPETVASIGSDGFSRCKNLTSISVSAKNPVFSSVDGVLFNHAKSQLIQYPRAKAGSAYIVPDGVTVIGITAFYKCTKLTSVPLPHGVTEIGSYAFSGCTNLINVPLPGGLKGLGVYAFYDCTKLSEITVPKSVDSIGQGAFQGCERLEKAEFEGNPPLMNPDVFKEVAKGFVVTYRKGATGLDSATWANPSSDIYGG